ncbi:MAG: hypothetical protein JOY99_15580 [Sphingomonadaceae bacterium]|nr:hypothetical protein [Sphingomonadaceae bacterium]
MEGPSTGSRSHGAHSYVITQFLSSELSHRRDCYGGSLANRSRLLSNVLDGIRKRCRQNFQLGVRLSAERNVRIPR